jgi:hypothetical protein
MKLINKCSSCKCLNKTQGWDKIITADTDYYKLPNEIINNDYVDYPRFDELKKWKFKEKWEDKKWEFEEKLEDKNETN